MSTFTSKMLAYCQHRANGAAQGDAARLAGYKGASAAITASRLEPRADVQAEIKRLRGKKPDGVGITVDGDDDAQSPVSAWALKKHYKSSLELLQDVYNNSKAPISVRIQCAKDALPFEHAKMAPLGKKEQKQADAEEAAAGEQKSKPKFKTRSAPTGRVIPLRQKA